MLLFFPVVIYECENWTLKKVEHRRTDAFELWCQRRPLRAPLTVRRSNESILKEISPENSLGGLMLKLRLQYFHQLMGRTDPLEKTLMLVWERLKAGGEADHRGGGSWMASLTQWTRVWANSGSWCYSPWGLKELDMTEQLNWNALKLSYQNSITISALLKRIRARFLWPVAIQTLVMNGFHRVRNLGKEPLK